MTIPELKAAVEKHRESLGEHEGKGVRTSKTGPVGMSVIDNIVATLEDLERRIAAMEKKR